MPAKTPEQELHDYRIDEMLRTMREISEDCWCAGWNSRLEHDLYLRAFKGFTPSYGAGLIAQDDLDKLRRHAELTNSWWMWDDTTHGPKVVPLSEAEKLFGKVGNLSASEILSIYATASLDPTQWDEEDHPSVGSRWTDFMSSIHAYTMKDRPSLRIVHQEWDDYMLQYDGFDVAEIKAPLWAFRD